MNRMLIFNEFAKKAQSDDCYYTFGNPSQIGIIEEAFAYFGLNYKIEPNSKVMHQRELNTLQDFILNKASEEQLSLIHEMVHNDKKLPEMDSLSKTSGSVFISMPMNKNKCKYVEQIRNGIMNAVKDTNNNPYFLDLDVHNDNIVNKMLREIISCKFLVADFTSQNNGVYYEAGYAKALGKTVIFTCKDEDFNNMHFDIKQMQTIVWNNEHDLRQKLCQHIIDSNLGEK